MMIETTFGTLDILWESNVRRLSGSVGCEAIVDGEQCITGSTLLLESTEATCHAVNDDGEVVGNCKVPRGAVGFGDCIQNGMCARNLMGTGLETGELFIDETPSPSSGSMAAVDPTESPSTGGLGQTVPSATSEISVPTITPPVAVPLVTSGMVGVSPTTSPSAAIEEGPNTNILVVSVAIVGGALAIIVVWLFLHQRNKIQQQEKRMQDQKEHMQRQQEYIGRLISGGSIASNEAASNASVARVSTETSPGRGPSSPAAYAASTTSFDAAAPTPPTQGNAAGKDVVFISSELVSIPEGVGFKDQSAPRPGEETC